LRRAQALARAPERTEKWKMRPTLDALRPLGSGDVRSSQSIVFSSRPGAHATFRGNAKVRLLAGSRRPAGIGVRRCVRIRAHVRRGPDSDRA